MNQAYAYAEEALKLDDSVSAPHRLMGQVLGYSGSHDLAIPELDRAIALEPNYSNNYVSKSLALTWAGRPAEALAPLKIGMRVDPQFPSMFFFAEGVANFGLRNWEDAIDGFKRSNARNPEWVHGHTWLAASLGIVGRVEEAKEACSSLLRLKPALTISEVRRELTYKRDSDGNNIIDGLRKAGLPE